MAHTPDLTEGRYHRGPYDSASWACPLLFVGWIEHPEPFTKGSVDASVVEQSVSLQHEFRDYTSLSFRGLHRCSICESQNEGASLLAGSHTNMFIPGESEVFFAPGRIDHYITEHGYQPPDRFITAMLNCPEPGSEDYFERLVEANDGADLERKWFCRDGLFTYTTIPSIPFSAGVLASERHRLASLSYRDAIGEERFEKLMVGLSQSYQEDTPLRSYKGSCRVGDEFRRVRVRARTPFAARAALKAHFGEIRSLSVRDEKRPSPAPDVVRKMIELPALPFSEKLFDISFARVLEERTNGHAGVTDDFLDYVRKQVTAELHEHAELRLFEGDIEIDDERIDLRVMAACHTTAEVAVVGHFGEGYSFSVRSSTRDAWPESTTDYIEVPPLPFSLDNLDRLFFLHQRRQRFGLSGSNAERYRARLAGRYVEDAPFEEFRGYVYADGARTWVRVVARHKEAAVAAVAHAFGTDGVPHMVIQRSRASTRLSSPVTPSLAR